MKKIGWLVLILIVVLSTVAFAEGELTFQGIPWLSDKDTTIRILQECNYVSEGENGIAINNDGEYIKNDEIINARPAKIVNNNGYCLSLKGKVNKKIAGYSVNDLLLTFALEGSNTKLIAVKVDFENADYSDILKKLNKVYGEGETKSNKEGVTTTIWYGDNNSSIILYMIEDGDLFNLMYGRLDAESMLSASQKDTAETEVDPEDVSGL